MTRKSQKRRRKSWKWRGPVHPGWWRTNMLENIWNNKGGGGQENMMQRHKQRERTERAGSAHCEDGCRALAGGAEARLSGDHQPHCCMCVRRCVCVCVSQTHRRKAQAPFWLCWSCCWAGLWPWWHRAGGVFVCVTLCCGMLNRIRGDLVRSSWYRDLPSEARGGAVHVCVVCIIGLAITWCGTVGVRVWTGLDWAGQELGRGERCVHVCVSVCVSVVACIIGLGTTWWGAVGAGHLPAVLLGSGLRPAIGSRPFGPSPDAGDSQPARSSAFPLPVPQRRKNRWQRRREKKTLQNSCYALKPKLKIIYAFICNDWRGQETLLFNFTIHFYKMFVILKLINKNCIDFSLENFLDIDFFLLNVKNSFYVNFNARIYHFWVKRDTFVQFKCLNM